eukprot:PLAT10118.1.p1 GENE.PLAT10118.1~~PLAT10118.1.p1  ORF type:complete len:207 (-),score=24.14 PLAT10118.1:82-654(-)
MAYYDIDAILSEEERVPVVFNVAGSGLGYLDPASIEDNLAQGSRVELPLWLAEALLRRNMVVITLPRAFAERSRAAILADPENAPLRERSAHFFRLGSRLAAALHDGELRRCLVRTLAQRCKRIMDQSQNSKPEDTSSFLDLLTHTEQQLFRAGFACRRAYSSWKARQQGKLRTADVLLRIGTAKRRKLA